MDSPMFPQAPGGAIRPLGFRASGRGAQSRLAPPADEGTFIGSGVLNAGMRGDRGFVILSAPGEISAFIKPGRQWMLALAKRGISRCT